MEKLMMNKEFMDNVPKFLLEQNEWLTWYNKKNKDESFTKPPLTRRGHTVKEDSPGCSINQAMDDVQHCGEYGGGVGFKLSDRHDVVFFDVDHIEGLNDLPNDFKEFLMLQDSYMEWSPSGKGLRIPFICKDKDKLPNKAKLNGMDGELFVRSGHVTITGDHLAGEDIKEITSYQLEQWFGVLSKKAEVIDIPINFKYPEISLVQEALNYCKLNQCDRIKNAYRSIMNQDYNHYDYWLKIMASCHHYALETNQMNKITEIIIAWSQTDEIAYESDENVISHWQSFSESENGIKFHTLMKFAKLLKFQWPEEKLDKNGGSTGKPIPTSLLNFEYLMDYYNLKVYCDIFQRHLYMTGDKDIIEKFFIPRGDTITYFGMTGPISESLMEAAICAMAQQNGYNGVAVSSLAQLFRSYIVGRMENFSMLEKWLTTSPKDLPEDFIEKNTDISKSNLKYLMSCIEFNHHQSAELAKMYFDTLFFEMVMPLYNPERILSQRSFMLILTGPEACRKTTFWSMLFPANLRRQFVTNSTETLGGAKSIRDFSTSLVTSVLVVCDEFENFYNKNNDSLFKSLVTADVVDYVPIYEKTMNKEDRNAVIVGTTNKRSLPFEQDSNRRLALVDVKWIDTDAMRSINWHHLYRHYVTIGKKAMINGLHPWKLTPDVIKLQYLENEAFRSQSNKEIILREIFDFDMEIHKEIPKYDIPGIQHNHQLLKMKDITGTLKQHYPEVYFAPAEMKHLLKRLCGKYTHTTNQHRTLSNAKGHIADGIVRQSGFSLYVMPPVKVDVF